MMSCEGSNNNISSYYLMNMYHTSAWCLYFAFICLLFKNLFFTATLLNE